MQNGQESNFIDDLMGKDLVGIVVRSHNHIDMLLDHLLKILVPYPEHLKGLELDYAKKVHLALAMGLDPKCAPSLKTLGSIRNRFAHRLDAELSKADTENLYKKLLTSEKDVVQASFKRTKKQVAPEVAKFEHLAPKSQFILLVVALRAKLSVTVSEAEARQHEAADSA